MSYRPRRPPRHETLCIRGLEYRLTWWGEPSAAPLVLLHGWMDVGDAWQLLVDCLPDSWSCVAPDWRGFGGSARAPGGYWFPDYLADLDALLDALVPHARARVVAHSMGGNIATLYAGARPRRLAWLVNLEGVGLARVSPERAPLRYEQWLEQLRAGPRRRHYDSSAQLAQRLRARHPRLSAAAADFLARVRSRPCDGGVDLAADPRHACVNPVLYRREEAQACWRRMEIPMLLLFGELSEYRRSLGEDATDECLHASFRELSIVSVPGTGHMMQYEDPQSVARHIVRFASERTDDATRFEAPRRAGTIQRR